MALFDLNVFLDKLAAYMAANAAGGALEYAATPRALWVGQADEKYAAAAYSTLIPFGGALPFVPENSIQIQCMSSGKNYEAAMGQAQKLFGALVDANGRPKRMIDISSSPNGYRLLGVNPQHPQVIASDATRTQVVFNFEAIAVRTA